jgi:hypothetical protein
MALTSQQWCESLRDAVRFYAASRRRLPAVEVTLSTGERFYVVNATAHGGLVALAPYEDDDPRTNVEGFSPRLVVVEPDRVAKLELFYDAPEHQAVGFGIEPPD